MTIAAIARPGPVTAAFAIRIAIEPLAFLREPVMKGHHPPHPLDAPPGCHLEQGRFQVPFHPLITVIR